MRCTAWLHHCAACGGRFAVPGADLSFSYGWFLGVSRTGRAVFLDAFADPVFAEIGAIVRACEREAGTVPGARGTSPAAVAGACFDPDPSGEPYAFVSPPCPRCGSARTTLVRRTDTPWPVRPSPATHTGWDTLAPAEKARTVREALAGLRP